MQQQPIKKISELISKIARNWFLCIHIVYKVYNLIKKLNYTIKQVKTVFKNIKYFIKIEKF